jgi:flagellar hook-associated protein 3 FlgL
MLFRITNSSQTAVLSARIALSRQRLEGAQERISSGKRINRPSDDPFGAEAVLRFRTSQASVEQFQQNAATVRDGLQSADGAMESYQQLLDRASLLLTQGASDLTSATSKASVAQEIEGIRTQMMTIANTKSNDRFLFGGTRQDVAPFDATGNPAVTATTTQMVQIEPDAAPIAAGVIADAVFSNNGGTVFAAMATAAAALRGTGNPAADKAAVLASMDNLVTFSNQSETGRAQLGASFNTVDSASGRLASQSLSFQESANRFESADFAEAAVELTQASNALQATLQATAYAGKGSLMDLIG